jgi:hypothetical protein
VSRRVPFGGLAALAVLLAIAAMPAVSYSAHVKKPHWLCGAKASECATLIVYLRLVGCPLANGECQPQPVTNPKALRISKLGSGPLCTSRLPRCWGVVLGNWYTEAHKVRVAPGHYGIAALESDSPTARTKHRSESKEVRVSAGQTLEVALDVRAI